MVGGILQDMIQNWYNLYHWYKYKYNWIQEIQHNKQEERGNTIYQAKRWASERQKIALGGKTTSPQ
jgi:hypothetical protein